MTSVSFFVPGPPQPQGSARAFVVAGRAHITSDNPLGNLQAAYRISAGGTNWNAWSCK